MFPLLHESLVPPGIVNWVCLNKIWLPDPGQEKAVPLQMVLTGPTVVHSYIRVVLLASWEHMQAFLDIKLLFRAKPALLKREKENHLLRQYL